MAESARWQDRRSRCVGAILALVLPGIAAGCGDHGGTASARPSTAAATTALAPASLTIAIGGPLTGPEQATGADLVAGAKLALAQIEVAGGIPSGPLAGARLQLHEYDDGDDPARAADAMRRIVADDSVVAFVGSGSSDASRAAAPIAADAGLAYLAAYARSPAIVAPPRPSVFVIPPTFPAYAAATAAELRARGLRRVAILYLRGAYGQTIADDLTARLPAQGASAVALESFGIADTDLQPALDRIRSQQPDALVMVGLAASEALIVRQAPDAGLRVPTFDAGGVAADAAFATAAGPFADGVVGLTAIDADRATFRARRLAATYAAANRRPLSEAGAFAYEAVLAIARALESAHGRADLPEHLRAVRFTDTGVGPLRFGSDGIRLDAPLWSFRLSGGGPDLLSGFQQVAAGNVRAIPLAR